MDDLTDLRIIAKILAGISVYQLSEVEQKISDLLIEKGLLEEDKTGTLITTF